MAREWGPQLLVVFVVFLGMRAWQLRGTAEGMAPSISGRSVQTPDQLLSLEALRGRPAVVYFWATWCGVCEQVDPNVAAVSRDHHVLTVAVQSGTPEAIAQWMDERDLAMPTVSDPASRLSRAYGVSAFPTTFWIDADGHIQHREVGYTSTLGLRARLWMTR
jgi:peroxiredoxin